ncbi:MAG: hypothetical protein EZS28_002436 [Streblomastix strix]|uniref:Uncharacterized protein n=1 Tax=Streblomastix strix TaxID=222440 RepID=A0A5J4X477_9EUKA|nr:MAG: hypothetical protein EZS28_002436 [Streblomastix strix]
MNFASPVSIASHFGMSSGVFTGDNISLGEFEGTGFSDAFSKFLASASSIPGQQSTLQQSYQSPNFLQAEVTLPPGSDIAKQSLSPQDTPEPSIKKEEEKEEINVDNKVEQSNIADDKEESDILGDLIRKLGQKTIENKRLRDELSKYKDNNDGIMIKLQELSKENDKVQNELRDITNSSQKMINEIERLHLEKDQIGSQYKETKEQFRKIHFLQYLFLRLIVQSLNNLARQHPKPEGISMSHLSQVLNSISSNISFIKHTQISTQHTFLQLLLALLSAEHCSAEDPDTVYCPHSSFQNEIMVVEMVQTLKEISSTNKPDKEVGKKGVDLNRKSSYQSQLNSNSLQVEILNVYDNIAACFKFAQLNISSEFFSNNGVIFVAPHLLSQHPAIVSKTVQLFLALSRQQPINYTSMTELNSIIQPNSEILKLSISPSSAFLYSQSPSPTHFKYPYSSYRDKDNKQGNIQRSQSYDNYSQVHDSQKRSSSISSELSFKGKNLKKIIQIQSTSRDFIQGSMQIEAKEGTVFERECGNSWIQLLLFRALRRCFRFQAIQSMQEDTDIEQIEDEIDITKKVEEIESSIVILLERTTKNSAIATQIDGKEKLAELIREKIRLMNKQKEKEKDDQLNSTRISSNARKQLLISNLKAILRNISLLQ